MAATKKYKAGSLDELVKVALEIKGELSSEFLWYRGMECSTYTLLPKLMRESKASGKVFERESRLITRFRQRSMPFWPAGYPQTDWEHLFAMQHYGLPTRLLDWTENLFVAAYFALSTATAHDHAGACVPVLFVLDPVQWNKAMPGLKEIDEEIQVLTTADDHLEAYRPLTNKPRLRSPVAIYGTHNSNRIVAQRGTFMVWGSDVKPLGDHGQSSLRQIRLVGSREKLFGDLRALGFTETMVYPELTYLATELSRLEGWR